MDDSLRSMTKLNEEVPDLRDELVSTYGVYCEWEKKVSFFYHLPDLRKMIFFKDISDGQLVDGEELPPWSPKGLLQQRTPRMET